MSPAVANGVLAAHSIPTKLPGHIKTEPIRSPLQSPFTPMDDSDRFDSTPPTGTTASPVLAANITVEPPQNPNYRWWWDRIAPLLECHLTTAKGYTPEEHASHMRVLRDVVVPTLGLPTPKASVTPMLTMDGSPFESSWNFQNGSDSTIRYTFEPLGDNAGTDADPFAGSLAKDPSFINLLRDNANPPADMRWFEQLLNAWFLEPSEFALAKANLPHGLKRMPQLFTAYDMKGPQRALKAYFFPMLKHIAHGTPTADIVFDTIRNLQPGGDKLAPLVDKLSAFLVQCKAEAGADATPVVEMMAIDCVDPARARVKVYARTQDNSMACVRRCMTLGGAQTDAVTMRGVEHMEKIWPFLLDEREHVEGLPDTFSKKAHEPRTLHKGCCFVFEMRAGASRIETKMHLPWSQFCTSDYRAVENFAGALRTLGWEASARKFEEGAMETGKLPGRDYTKAGGVSYVSYNYNKGGPYTSCYFSALTNQ